MDMTLNRPWRLSPQHIARAPGHLVPGQWCSSSYSKGGSSCRGYIPKTWGLPWWQLGTPFTHRSEFSPCLNLYLLCLTVIKKDSKCVQSLWNHQIVVYPIGFWLPNSPSLKCSQTTWPSAKFLILYLEWTMIWAQRLSSFVILTIHVLLPTNIRIFL